MRMISREQEWWLTLVERRVLKFAKRRLFSMLMVIVVHCFHVVGGAQQNELVFFALNVSWHESIDVVVDCSL